MPLPEAVFSSRVPAGLWLVMLVAKVVAALAVEVISWRMGACVTMAVETGTWAAAPAVAGRAGWIGVASKTHEKSGKFQNISKQKKLLKQYMKYLKRVLHFHRRATSLIRQTTKISPAICYFLISRLISQYRPYNTE